jgi:hypothetical protein
VGRVFAQIALAAESDEAGDAVVGFESEQITMGRLFVHADCEQWDELPRLLIH